MLEDDVRQFLEDNGYPPHIVRGGGEGLILRWSEFVTEVERGYEYGLEDYRNDLDLRGAIEMLSLGGDPRVADADRRFEALLTGRELRVWESIAFPAFWDFGYPRNASGILLRDLRAAGFVE